MLTYSAVEMEHNHVGVRIKGDLDIEGTELIENELYQLLSRYDSANLNLENVPFVDSTGIGLLMNLVQTLNVNGTKITISHVKGEVYEVFELLQLPKILGDEVFAS